MFGYIGFCIDSNVNPLSLKVKYPRMGETLGIVLMLIYFFLGLVLVLQPVVDEMSCSILTWIVSCQGQCYFDSLSHLQ